MLKGMKQSNKQMKRAKQAECLEIGDLFEDDIPVWYESNGQVSSEWLSICEEERHQTIGLMEQITRFTNLQRAYKSVKSNGGSSGIDGMSIKSYGEWLKGNYETLQTTLLNGSYVPQVVKGVKIPKSQGGYRQLGIPTVQDRVVQQAINQVLQVYYDPKFSEQSYGFRPKRSTHQALASAQGIVKSGKTKVVDIDLSKFFDEVNHQRLMWLLGTRIGDKRLLKLIQKILKTGILEGGVESQRIKGTPQGSPLSPLLSNIVLDELDQELTRRGLSFVRYADDVKIFTSSWQSANRIMVSVSDFIERRMHLKVNREKSGVRRSYEVTFLGYSLLYGGKLGLSKTSEQRLKEKIKQITRRNRGISFVEMLKELQLVLQGWLQYYRYAMMKQKLQKIEGWLRRRLKCFRLKQCKRAIGIVRLLRSLGVEKTLCWRTALSGKGWWRKSNSPATNIEMSNQWFAEQGFYSLTDNYEKLHRKSI